MKRWIWFWLCWCWAVGAWAQEDEKTFQLAGEYFSQQQLDKALPLYEKLVKEESWLAKAHKPYLACMFGVKDWKGIDKYLKRLHKRYPGQMEYVADYAIYLRAKGDESEAVRYLDAARKVYRENAAVLGALAAALVTERWFEQAEQTYQTGTKYAGEPYRYEMAELYRLWGRKPDMIEQYLLIAQESNAQLEFVQNALQDQLATEEDFALLEKILIAKVQAAPDEMVYSELLLWYYLQRKEFYKAFTQAKAVDRRKKMDGMQVMDIARLAFSNEQYNDAIRITEYLTERYRDKPVYQIAKNLMIRSKELLVRTTYPVRQDQIRSLITDYEALIQEFGLQQATAEALINQATLEAFYLSEYDRAVARLNALIQTRGISRQTISEAKLALGDVYLLKEEHWEASLLYSQVEKSEKDKNLGHQAKLRNARLSFYKGEFELAKSHLDILKLATSREIANDALDLSLLIADNLELDTNDVAMKTFAELDLLVFRQQYEQALDGYNQMLKVYSTHSLADEILWEKSKIQIRMGKYTEAIATLEEIIKDHNFDIYADDANFVIGKLYHEQLRETDKAMEYFRRQLTDYPGSIHNVEARKRFRQLRGDKLN